MRCWRLRVRSRHADRSADLTAEINDAKFGIPEAGFPIQRAQQNLGPNPNRRPFVCENGTYRIVSATFNITQRGSSTEPRPAPYTAAFNQAFPNIITFVGTSKLSSRTRAVSSSG